MALVVELAAPGDDASIRRLLRRSPMPGRIRITYEREPEFRLGCEVMGDECQVLVARAEGEAEVVGVACRASRAMFVNGVERRMGYLGQLRVDERYRGRWLLSRGFAQLRQLHDQDPMPAYLASLIDGNDEAAGVLVRRRRPGFPEFQPVAEYRTLAMDVRRRPTATPCGAEWPEVARFLQTNGPRRQFFDVWTEARLRRLDAFGLRDSDVRVARRPNGELAAVAALWDQSAFKQSVVSSYSGWLRAVAPVQHMVAPWLGRAPLPRPGEKLRSVYAALICVADDDPHVFRDVLDQLHALAHQRGFHYLLAGLDARDPLLAVALGYDHVLYKSSLYLAQWPEGGHPTLEPLDGRPSYVEIATL